MYIPPGSPHRGAIKRGARAQSEQSHMRTAVLSPGARPRAASGRRGRAEQVDRIRDVVAGHRRLGANEIRNLSVAVSHRPHLLVL